ncbi:hypothetical protein LWI28_011967 [Acer negundo]|uniref:Uncharacterized protein n=1 Tax=Acer negundo TaxID=4023 RepID=A0AAD5JE40_ACENE|nr:hypothetical protein LWI28_011967 [Acer negundo]
MIGFWTWVPRERSSIKHSGGGGPAMGFGFGGGGGGGLMELHGSGTVVAFTVSSLMSDSGLYKKVLSYQTMFMI